MPFRLPTNNHAGGLYHRSQTHHPVRQWHNVYHIPDWFPEYGKHYAIGGQDDEFDSCDITRRRGYLWGAGMASRTELFNRMYFQLPSFLIGRTGKELIGGEDTE